MKLLIILFISLILCGCDTKKEIKVNPNNELKEILLADNYIIVDVRTKEEYNEEHVKDALNIPYNEINESTGLDKTKVIMVYCKSGNRSKIAEDKLIDLLKNKNINYFITIIFSLLYASPISFNTLFKFS